MDVLRRVEMIERPPTEEIVTRDELVGLLETNQSPQHYIGLEISGFLHLGSLISTGFKINDLADAGVRCRIFLADWHTMINDKLGGDWDAIREVSGYYREAFRLVCPDAEMILGSELYERRTEYWSEIVRFTKHMSIARTMRTLTIMGRAEDDARIDVAKLLYPAMQAVDIHSMDVDIAHAGMDQRKIHMLVREIFPRMGWKVPVAVHHSLLPGLSRPADAGMPGKMSKTDPNSGIFMHDTDEEIRRKINRAWCEKGSTRHNPLLEIARVVIFHEFDGIDVQRPSRFGGDVHYAGYEELEADFAAGTLHPGDLKQAVADHLIRIIRPIRERLRLSDALREAIGNY